MRRTKPLALVQVAPLIVAAIAAALWFSAPPEVRSFTLWPEPQLSPSVRPSPTPPDPTALALQAILGARETPSARGAGYTAVIENQSLEPYAALTAAALVFKPSQLVDTRGLFKPFALPPTDPAFLGVTQYEQSAAVHVVVAALPGAVDPPVVLRSVTDSAALTLAQSEELRTKGTLESLRIEVRQLPAPPPPIPGLARGARALPVDTPASGFGGGTSDGVDALYETTSIGGRLYEVYSIGTGTDSAIDPSQIVRSWKSVDAPGNQRELDRAIAGHKGGIFVIGPVDAAPVLERVPPGLTVDAATRLLRLTLAALPDVVSTREAFHLTPAMKAAIGGRAEWGEVVLVTPANTAVEPTTTRPAMLFASYSDSNPLIPALRARVGGGMAISAWVFVLSNFAAFLGGLIVFLLVSLIASPAAFVIERRLSEEADVERERALVQRRARERVLGRLTELSERMDAAAAAASGSVGGDIATVSADIDETVAELKRILGEAPLGTGGGHDA